MNRKDRRRQALLSILNSRSKPISIAELREALFQANDERQPSRSVLYEDIQWLREQEAPIELASQRVQLTQRPWHLFDELSLGPYDLSALIAAQRVLVSHGGHWFSEQLSGLEKQLRKRLGSDFALDPERIRVLRNRVRSVSSNQFGVVVEALLKRFRIRARYFGRSHHNTEHRLLSPQRLVLYRSNWYLDAFDHNRDGLRTLAVERLDDIEMRPRERAFDVPASKLDSELAAGYGIFSGPVSDWAHIRFSGLAAEYAAEQHWHHEQQMWCDLERRLHLRLPYSQPHELVQDVLFWANDAEVLAPAVLRKTVAEKIQAMHQLYV